ncbi:MAG: DUF4198 domain-containing protein [Gammaproteobacteria bacterium]|nr:DUF4198 domain-containing protein [Gammaproteobacteria bacterium]
MLTLAVAGGNAIASEVLWLSEVPPHAGHGGGEHAHGGTVVKRRGVYYKNLWLRHEDNPQQAGYVQQLPSHSPLLLLDTSGQPHEQAVQRDAVHGLYNVEFPMPEEGFYNAYLTHQRLNVDEGRRLIYIAKAEVLKHSCREGHDDVQSKMPPRHNPAIPLELVRERLPKENFHSLLSHGDTVSFQVLRNGEPLPGAAVTFTTAQGWSRQALSDSEGRVSYTLIRDYYPPWHEFEKRKAQPYLVIAAHTVPEAGEVEGTPYRQTVYRSSLAGNYYPSPRDYESYAYGISFGLFALLATGLGIYLYRRRRHRPYREVQFDE